jgi:WD40-like Beta Propeller Repeat
VSLQPMLRTFVLAGVFALTATVSGGASEIVIAIRYLQAKGTSHSHLYLYREDGKLLRQLTNDNSGQDIDPIFTPDGKTIAFTREKPNDTREFWSIDPRGTKPKKFDAAPDWYLATKSSPYFTNIEQGEEQSSSASPAAAQEESGPPSATGESAEQREHPSMTALDAVAEAKDRPPATIKAPAAAGEIFWRKGEDKEDPLDWVMWFRDSNSGQEAKVGKLRGFPSFEPLQIRQNKDQQFLFEGPLRLTFFSCHLNSTDGDTVEAFDFNKRKLIQLSPNWATPIPLPGEAAFLTLTENRYVEIPGSSKTANCSYVERWGVNIKERCYDQHDPPYCAGEPQVRYARKDTAAICYGASMYRPGKNPPVITIRNGAD